MDLATLKPVIDWLAANPTWGGLAVFLISVSESLAVVGLFIPGVAMMFGIGTLVAMGALDLWSTLAWAAAGAIVGDGISYWLGYHYKDRLRGMWPFSRYPALMTRGESFFTRHGGKSVLFGRFVGPVRPVIPVIAGMLGMPPAQFLMVNVASAVAWAPAYTLPGVVFGASLNLASEVASRLAVLLLTVLVTLWLTLWLTYRIYRLLYPRASAIMDRLLAWGGEHRYAGRLVSSVLDPEHPEWRGLAVLAGLLIMLAVGLIGGGRLLFEPALLSFDTTVLNFMQSLRAPWPDQLMVFLADLSLRPVSLPVAAAVMIWLAWRQHWLALLHAGGASLFAVILSFALAWGMASPSAGGIVSNTVLYGLLAVMIAQGLKDKWRWLPYGAAGLLVAAFIFARLYLGMTEASGALAAWLLALLWVTLLGAAFRRHSATPMASGQLSLVTGAALLLSASTYVSTHFQQDLARHTPRYAVQTLDATAWWDGGWQTLPPYRLDLEDHAKQPLSVQWAGPLDPLAAQLEGAGWQAPPALNSAAVLHWLLPSPALGELPLLPQVHDDRHDVLRLVHGDGKGGWSVLRLWPADRLLQNPRGEVWVGTVTSLRAAHPLPLFTVPLTGSQYNAPLQQLQASLGELNWRAVRRADTRDDAWDGTVLLLRARAPAGEP